MPAKTGNEEGRGRKRARVWRRYGAGMHGRAVEKEGIFEEEMGGVMGGEKEMGR